MGVLSKVKAWAGQVSAIADALREAKKATADAARLDDEIARRRIKSASDLDHNLIRRVLEGCPDGVQLTILLNSGESILIERRSDRPTVKKGSLEW